MKKIIYSQIAKDSTKFFFLTIFTISLIIWILQAVNYLDFVIEDGHGFLVYFNYTILNFPKIFSRIFPFAIFLAFSYTLLKYENKNELVIFWNFGIKKIDFINFFIKFSFFFVFLSLLLNTAVVPLAQDKARSFIRSSDLDFFESALKPKKFIDIITNLTIYYDEKNKNGILKNILINEKLNVNESQITFAKNGEFEMRGDKKILVLYDGRTINNKDGNISEFKYSRTEYNITKFGSRTTKQKKTKENSTLELIKCSLILNNIEFNLKGKKAIEIINCRSSNLKNIYKELYSRLIKPLYTTFLVTISLLFILKSKSEHKFIANKFRIYFLGFIFIIFYESSSELITTNLFQNLFISILPLLFFFIIYVYFLKTLKINKT